MNLFLRLMLALRAARRASRIGLDGVAEIAIRVSRRDLNAGGRLPKDRFASFSDLGILAFLTRTGVLGICRREGWLPIVAGRELDLLSADPGTGPARLVTRLTGWDERYTFFEQELFLGDTLAARIRTIGRVAAPGEKAPIVARVLEALGLPADVDGKTPPGFAPALDLMKAARSA